MSKLFNLATYLLVCNRDYLHVLLFVILGVLVGIVVMDGLLIHTYVYLFICLLYS